MIDVDRLIVAFGYSASPQDFFINKGVEIDADGLVKLDGNEYKYQTSNEKFFGPTLAGNFLWITGTDGYLRKFDPSTGKQFSKHRIGHQILYRTYAVHDKLFIISKSGKIIAFD